METNNNNCRILNLEGAYIIKREINKEEIMETKLEYSTKNRKINSIYTGSMPFSLELFRAFPKVENQNFIIGRDTFTTLFVNLKFNKKFKVMEDKEILNDAGEKETIKVPFEITKKNIRTLLYTNTIKIDDVEYRFFKRGASKARTSNVIFVKKDFYDLLYTPCLLGLEFEIDKEYDITSREAYTSLIMSNIISTLEIKKSEILIIKDLESPSFPAKQTLTVKDATGVHQVDDTYDVINNMTDGEGLMDESKYLDNEILEKATCVLLRNDFTKVNVCRTRLQDYYKELFGADYETSMVYDAWGRPKLASTVKLVITPSACKFIKFKSQFDNDDMKAYDNWLNMIPTTFGIVKTDHIGAYNYDNRLSYQMLNSMNLDKPSVLSLMKDELEHIKYMKDNTLETSATIRKMGKKAKLINRAERNEMTYFLERVTNSQEGSTGEMITDLLKTTSDFKFTPKFKNWKSKQLQDYIDNMRRGKIRIKNSLYAIAISCPYEMMLATTKIDNTIDSCILNGWEVYCPKFDKEPLLLIRNPQVNAGNIAHVSNTYHKEFKWFGYYEDKKAKHDFVVFVNTYNVDLMNRAQGMDFDIDSVYLTNNDLLVKHALDSQEWITPVNGIKGETGSQINTMEALADLDNYLGGSTLTIGKIINKSAIFNGYMYNEMNTNKSEKFIKACYNASSTCSSFSQIAIDMAKKNFKGLSLSGELSKLNKTTFLNADGEKEKVLKFKIDMENVDKIKTKDYVKDYIKVNSPEEKYDDYHTKYELVSNIDIETLVYDYDSLKELKDIVEIARILTELDVEILVHMEKMIVPYFFKYTAQSNAYRIPTHMKCSMDYLEELIDEIDMKAIGTDKILEKDLFQMQKELTGTSHNTTKLDDARRIISDCHTALNKNCYDVCDNKEEGKRKSNLRRWLKNTAIADLKTLELNPKTIHKIVMRAFGADDKYKGFKLVKYNEDNEAITYIDYDEEYDFDVEYLSCYKELSEMTMTVLNLLYNAYREDFLNCFKEI